MFDKAKSVHETHEEWTGRLKREQAKAEAMAADYQRAQYARKTAQGPVSQSEVLAGHGDFSGAAMGQMIGSAQGVDQMLQAPGKMFSRVEILAVLKSRKAMLEGRPYFEEVVRELDALIDIFTRME
jgi:hypothetical protein